MIRNAIAAFIIAVGLCSCGSRVVKMPPAALPPVKTAPVAPKAVVVRENITTAVIGAADLRTGLTRAVDEADRLRLQKSATEAELNSMWSVLTKERDSAANLFNQLESTQKLADTLTLSAMDRDAEVTQLRSANEVLTKQVDAARANEGAIAKLEEKAAVYDFFSKWIMWLTIGSVVFFILYVILRYWPAIAARFARPL